ncbi:MAG: hypothetical protein A2096_06360 [Spirochaetes bacterium GWF1_41_5]|nr:MAG: hypothetical protein A2096_06360 [Spirochaetes bacterium GWF1_41_5]
MQQEVKKMPTWQLVAELFGNSDEKASEAISGFFPDYPACKPDRESIRKNLLYLFPGDEAARRFDLFYELFTRLLGSRRSYIIKNPVHVFKIMSYLCKCPVEKMVGIYLNIKNRILARKDIAVGSYNSVLCTPADVFIPALKLNARNFILAHNHPSEDPSPSREDIIFTKKISSAAGQIGLQFIDHIIVGPRGYYSFKKNGLL